MHRLYMQARAHHNVARPLHNAHTIVQVLQYLLTPYASHFELVLQVAVHFGMLAKTAVPLLKRRFAPPYLHDVLYRS